METFLEWLPRIGAILTVALGLVGFFKPRVITDGQQIELKSPMALSEARVVFGGLPLGGGIVALVLHEPLVYMTLGAAWSVGLLAMMRPSLLIRAMPTGRSGALTDGSSCSSSGSSSKGSSSSG